MAILALSGCGTEVLLGGATDAGSDSAVPDAPQPDAAAPVDAPSATPFPDGAYDLAVSSDAEIVVCTGSLAGMEPTFMALTRDDIGLVDGEVSVHGLDATHVEVSGHAIEAGYGATSVQLERGGGPGVPDDVWIGVSSGPLDPGPLGTALVARVLEAHELTLDATGFDGRAGAMYADLATEGDCSVGFPARFTAR